MSSAMCREENEKTTETGEFVPVVKGPHIYSEWCPARLCVTLLLLPLSCALLRCSQVKCPLSQPLSLSLSVFKMLLSLSLQP